MTFSGYGRARFGIPTRSARSSSETSRMLRLDGARRDVAKSDGAVPRARLYAEPVVASGDIAVMDR